MKHLFLPSTYFTSSPLPLNAVLRNGGAGSLSSALRSVMTFAAVAAAAACFAAMAADGFDFASSMVQFADAVPPPGEPYNLCPDSTAMYQGTYGNRLSSIPFSNVKYRNGVTMNNCGIDVVMYIFLYKYTFNNGKTIPTDLASDYIVSMKNSAYLFVGYSGSSLSIQAFDEGMDLSGGGYGRVLIDIIDNEFYGSARTDIQGSSLNVLGQLSPGSVVNIVGNNIFGSSTRTPKNPMLTWVNDPYVCSGIYVNSLNIPDNVQIHISNNRLEDFYCFYTSNRPSSAITVGQMTGLTPVGHHSIIDITNNTAYVNCFWADRNRGSNCYLSSIDVSNLLLRSGSELHIRRNYLSGAIGDRINARKLSFEPRRTNDPLPPPVVSIYENHITSEDPASIGFLMAPQSTMPQYISADTKFRVGNSGPGTIIFEGNIIQKLKNPVVVTLTAVNTTGAPGQGNQPFSSKGNYTLVFSNNEFIGDTIETVIQLNTSVALLDNATLHIKHNRYHIGPKTNALWFAGGTVRATQSSIEVAQNVGTPATNSAVPGGFAMFNTSFALMDEASSASIMFCNNVVEGVRRTATRVSDKSYVEVSGDSFNGLGLEGQGLSSVRSVSCYRCECDTVGWERYKEYEAKTCEEKAYCCSFSKSGTMRSRCMKGNPVYDSVYPYLTPVAPRT